jgi:hypothetical protein
MESSSGSSSSGSSSSGSSSSGSSSTFRHDPETSMSSSSVRPESPVYPTRAQMERNPGVGYVWDFDLREYVFDREEADREYARAAAAGPPPLCSVSGGRKSSKRKSKKRRSVVRRTLLKRRKKRTHRRR